MKKMTKKISAFFLVLALAVPMLGTVVFAADGRIQFSDPETQVGSTVEVKIVSGTESGEALGDITIKLSYDTEYLEFVSGDNATSDGEGTITYVNSGDGTVSEYSDVMEFTALQEGETVIKITGLTAYYYSGDTVTLTEGQSTVTIAAADDGTTSIEGSSGGSETAGETTDVLVTVNGTDYYFSEAYTSEDIPSGYSEISMTFSGEERKFVSNDAGVILGYLVDGDGNGAFFLYSEDDATFSPYTAIAVSDTTTIVLLSDTEGLTISSAYQEGELTVSDLTYPYWVDPEDTRYDILYALNTRTGEKEFYRYDTEDETYQVFEMPAEEEETAQTNALLAKIGSLMASHTLIVLLAGGILGLLLLILMIVFAVKLVHRNQELDDLYDEYDIPFDDEDDYMQEEPEKEKKGKKNKKNKKGSYGRGDDEDYAADDGYRDDYPEDGYADDYAYDDYANDSYGYADEDDYTSAKSDKGGKKSGRRDSFEDDDDIDFIDL